jgi:hypothetical protein
VFNTFRFQKIYIYYNYKNIMSESETQTKLTDEQRQEVLEKQVVTKISVLAQICKIIEGCTQRGAFKAEESSYVGGIYDALNKVVNDATKQVMEESVTVEDKVVEGEEEKPVVEDVTE